MSSGLHQEPCKAHAHCVFPSHTTLFVKGNRTYSQQSAVPRRFVGTFHISTVNCLPSFSAGRHGDRPGIYIA